MRGWTGSAGRSLCISVVCRAVSAQEHPVTGEPWYFFHPCRTAERMAAVLHAYPAGVSSIVYLLAWWSIIAPLMRVTVHPGQWKAALDDVLAASSAAVA